MVTPHTYEKVKVKGHSVQMLRVKQTDRRMDRGDCITSHANTVGKHH